jgi:hypothetical protein
MTRRSHVDRGYSLLYLLDNPQASVELVGDPEDLVIDLFLCHDVSIAIHGDRVWLGERRIHFVPTDAAGIHLLQRTFRECHGHCLSSDILDPPP